MVGIRGGIVGGRVRLAVGSGVRAAPGWGVGSRVCVVPIGAIVPGAVVAIGLAVGPAVASGAVVGVAS